jgi:hypothetical protein
MLPYFITTDGLYFEVKNKGMRHPALATATVQAGLMA